MRFLIVLTFVFPLLCLPAGCKRRGAGNPAATVEEESEIESSINVADPSSATQILHGFHAVEGGAWRWSMRRFSVLLRPPDGSARQGAWLEMSYTFPQAISDRLKSISITATIDGFALPPVKTPGTGGQTYRQKVPANLMNKDLVTVEFNLDKALAAGTMDARELGLVVSQIGLTSQ